MSEVLNYFNKRAEKFLESHLDNGWSKCFAFMKEKVQGNHANLIQEGKDLLSYAIMNAEAIQKILKKYDKVHCSMKGQRFRSEAQSMHLEVLRSPFLYELMAFNINMREDKLESKRTTPKWFEDCSLHIGDGKPSLSINLSSSINFSADLTCSICLETVFDPVSLLCGHIYCYMCACSAASVTTIEGLKAANSKSRCPLCREDGVFEGAVHMDELSILLSRR
ncbi:hypothetical protein RJ639_030689 [Escallonia herrerae]|uniref:RING-type E3 ubiquitin transferase n=1 Tax=Escallonia herrerae TaxID=1293975 RepID=A0AA89BDF8_9ASTE|nr:hypothetical protein RJ639_030689 [Escallonia herrerae]